MSWLYVFLLLGAALAIGRIWFQVKKLREQPVDDWDARLIERLRRGGADPFRPIDVDFFVAMPSESAAAGVAERLEAEGFRVDVRAVSESTEHPWSVHAIKPMQLNADGIRSVSTRLRELAAAQGGRYDGWTASQPGAG
ncbi:MAG: ribonuclease E inhibitor RraB [Steroidobacteraceae bacterium]|jgi:hypothetical protein|nr:ribonuclease E inhibitor RraB [Steroidobacteraceae bacterium]